MRRFRQAGRAHAALRRRQEKCDGPDLVGQSHLCIGRVDRLGALGEQTNRQHWAVVIGIFGLAPVDLKLVDPSKPAWRYGVDLRAAAQR
jgi:hypothetical protein